MTLLCAPPCQGSRKLWGLWPPKKPYTINLPWAEVKWVGLWEFVRPSHEACQFVFTNPKALKYLYKIQFCSYQFIPFFSSSPKSKSPAQQGIMNYINYPELQTFLFFLNQYSKSLPLISLGIPIKAQSLYHTTQSRTQMEGSPMVICSLKLFSSRLFPYPQWTTNKLLSGCYASLGVTTVNGDSSSWRPNIQGWTS